jgi:hypothetical protein
MASYEEYDPLNPPPNFMGSFINHDAAEASVSNVFTDGMTYYNTTNTWLWWWRANNNPDGYGGYVNPAGWYLYETWDNGQWYEDGYGGYTNNLGDTIDPQNQAMRTYSSNPNLVGTQLTRTFMKKHYNKNAFLFHQQAICQGPINAVWDVIVDESKFLTDQSLGTNTFNEIHAAEKLKAAMRIDIHNNGGVADSIMTTNYGSRRFSTFDNVAYASVVTHLDRINPQLTGAPLLQFLVEGKTIKTINRSGTPGNYTYTLSGTAVYSNNPAYVLLDYLLNPVGGKAVPLTDINLGSFYDSAQVCGKIVQNNVLVGGNIWQPVDGSRNIQTRNLPLYECNIVLDPEKPIRENVESILSTMGDARLVWSQGQYKLSVLYPENNTELGNLISGTITDDDIVMGEDVEVAFPSASERYNHVTVKYANEAENFKDDFVSWPPKFGSENGEQRTFLQGLGSFSYAVGSGNWEVKRADDNNQLLTDYSVWNGTQYSSTVEYLIVFPKELAINLGTSFSVWACCDSAMPNVNDVHGFELRNYTPWNPETQTGGTIGSIIRSGSTSNKDLLKFEGVPLGNTGADTAYYLRIRGIDTDGEKPDSKGGELKGRGIAARIHQGSNIIWTTRDPSYSLIQFKKINNYLYYGGAPSGHAMFGFKGFYKEDNNKELETEIFAEGITDYYHALAKAEELVRTSRGAFKVKLPYKIRDKIYEPGDFIQLSSETLKLGIDSPLYFRVDAANISNELVSSLELTRVDSSFLAWNMKDDEYRLAPPAYSDEIPFVRYITYIDTSVFPPYNTSGRLEWEAVNYQHLKEYVLYMHIAEYEADYTGFPIFKEIGRTTGTFFDIPPTNALFAIFGITVMNRDGRESVMTYTNAEYDPIRDIKVVTGVAVNQPWRSPTGNYVWNPDGLIGGQAYIDINGTYVYISDLAAERLTPATTYIGEFSSHPRYLGEFASAPTETSVLSWNETWTANLLYYNTSAGMMYVLSGEPLAWTPAPQVVWRQNAIYKNIVDEQVYILTGDPLAWVIYLESGKLFYLNIESSNGQIFRVGQAATSTLSARLFKNAAEVTDVTEASWFVWERHSNDPAADALWNAANTGVKSVLIHIDDFYGRATFFCSVISDV